MKIVLPDLRPMPVSEHQSSTSRRRWEGAFTLLEVMIAMAVFFIAIFAILDLTSQNLAAARQLQTIQLDASGVAMAVAMTNVLEEGILPPEIISQFEEQYPGYTCGGEIFEVSSNGLFQVDLQIGGLKNKKVVMTSMSILLYRPESVRARGGFRR